MVKNNVTLCIFKFCNTVDEAPVDHGAMEEFGVLFSFLEPLDSRLLFPKGFLLLVSVFKFLF